MHWFDNPSICQSLPPLYRAYALYSRQMADRDRSFVRGGSRLLSIVGAVTKALGLTREADVPLGDLHMFIDLCDPRMLWVFGEVLEPRHESRILRACLTEGDTFLDLGANHGSYSLIAAPLVGASGRVAAFEPQPLLAALLRRSFEVNRFLHATVYEMACADRSGESTLYLPAAGSGSAGLYERFSGASAHRRLTVRTARLDDVLDRVQLPGRVFMKLDVEGSELAALHGAERLLRTRRPTLLFELNPLTAEAAGSRTDDVLVWLGSLGYECFSEVETFPACVSLEQVERTRQRNLVALPGPLPCR